MNQLMGVARFTSMTAVEEFKRLSQQFMDIVREKDTGTTLHEISTPTSRRRVIEQYLDDAAFRDHLAHIGPG